MHLHKAENRTVALQTLDDLIDHDALVLSAGHLIAGVVLLCGISIFTKVKDLKTSTTGYTAVYEVIK